MVVDLDAVLAEELSRWPAGAAAVVVLDVEGVRGRAGQDESHPWASVTKLLSALAVLVAAHDDLVDLDEPAGPPGSTVRHLLAHASGLAFDSDRLMAPPGERRVYSNRGIEVLAEHVAGRVEQPFEELVDRTVLEPLGMRRTRLEGSAAHGARGPVDDLALLAHELLRPTRLDAGMLGDATRTAFPGLDGLLPGFGRQRPNDWGLGFEIRGHKDPHWTSPANAPTTFGHFGQSGAFVWVDPEAGLACAAAGENDFGPWAADAWPRLSTRVLQTAGR